MGKCIKKTGGFSIIKSLSPEDDWEILEIKKLNAIIKAEIRSFDEEIKNRKKQLNDPINKWGLSSKDINEDIITNTNIMKELQTMQIQYDKDKREIFIPEHFDIFHFQTRLFGHGHKNRGLKILINNWTEMCHLPNMKYLD